MRLPVFLMMCALVGLAGPAAAAGATVPDYAAKCKAASFLRDGPGTISSAKRDAAIKRCINNKGFLD